MWVTYERSPEKRQKARTLRLAKLALENYDQIKALGIPVDYDINLGVVWLGDKRLASIPRGSDGLEFHTNEGGFVKALFQQNLQITADDLVAHLNRYQSEE